MTRKRTVSVQATALFVRRSWMGSALPAQAAADLFVTKSGPGAIKLGETITEFLIPTANSRPYGITTGPDGFLWCTEESGNKIGRISP